MTGWPVPSTASIVGPNIPCSSPLPWSISTGATESVGHFGSYTNVATRAPSGMSTRTAFDGGMEGRAYGLGKCRPGGTGVITSAR